MTARIEKTVFISYRRDNVPWALCIYQNLTMHGYDVFFDYLSIDSGNFEKVIVENIKTRAHFIVILTPSALERCKEPGDWLRREIETAMDEKRNIVPLMLESFDFGSPLVKEALSGKLSTLNQYNGLRAPSEYFLEAMNRLRDRYLAVALEDIALPTLNNEAQEITKIQKNAANEAPPVAREQLTAQEWYERGFLFVDADNFDEAIRCYTEAIRLSPDFFQVYNSRGVARRLLGDTNGAIADFSEALRVKPDFVLAYNNRGRVHLDNRDIDKAITDHTSAIQIKPDDPDGYYSRGELLISKGNIQNALVDLFKASELDPEFAPVRALLVKVLNSIGKTEDAKEQEEVGRNLIQEDIEYNRACFEAICGHADKALELLKIGLEKEQVTREWARRDTDFESVRNDPRFKELVGEQIIELGDL